MEIEEALDLINRLFKSDTENEFLVGMADTSYITAQGNRATCYILCAEAMIIKVQDTLRILDEKRIITEDVSIKLIRNNNG